MLSTGTTLAGFSACASAAFVMVLALSLRGLLTRSWHVEKARVTRLKLVTRSVEDKSLRLAPLKRAKRRIAELVYDYEIAGTRFAGHCVLVFGFMPLGGAQTEKFMGERNIAEGATIDIYVNPKRQSESVIANGIPTGNTVVFGVIAIVASVLLILSALASNGSTDTVVIGGLVGIVIATVTLIAVSGKAMSKRLK